MTSLYLEKKNREWFILVKTVKRKVDQLRKINANVNGLFYFSPIEVDSLTNYIEFYNPYKKLLLKAEIKSFIYEGLRKIITTKKHKSGDRINYVINNGRFCYVEKEINNGKLCFLEKEVTSPNLTYEILIKTYFTYDNFMKLYNKVDHMCKIEQRRSRLFAQNHDIITINLN